ncbi:hypothetical protein GmHk_12G035106 [Glycine max]|nr:hypothetical protein GmHk_12G035106 [Glycine max]
MTHLHVPTPRKIGNSLEHSESSAMVSTRGGGGHGNRGGRGGGGGRNTNSDLRCLHCKKQGHTKDKCYYIIG